MALADIPTGRPARRLDSWKEIAEYLGRDVRTATRWEAQGMPVHRVPGGRGSSVFALSEEIDAWLRGNDPERPGAAIEEVAEPAAIAPRLAARARQPRLVLTTLACAAAMTLAIAALGFRRGAQGDGGPLRVTATEMAVSVAAGGNPARVIHTFSPGRGILPAVPPGVADLNADGEAEVLVGVMAYHDATARSIQSGELLNLSPAGAMRWRFGFRDVLDFSGGAVSGPWGIADWQAGPATAPARVAVAAHDYIWWASLVAVLDPDGRRLSAFVNPGWIESLLWLGPDRLAIAGFNNARNAAMVALLDANAADGQAPGTEGTAYACLSCPRAEPLFYATFPRSELNLLLGARFNRAQVALVGDRITLTTIEVQDAVATAIYEFDRGFRLLRARYSETYWDTHGRLEREGRLTHTRAACPGRNGPPAIDVWSGEGWTRTTPTQ